MRWNIETITEQNQRLSNWHRWFAWYPVPVKNEQTNRTQLVWLETVQRKGRVINKIGTQYYWEWSFKLDPCVFDLLKKDH
jgi:hypothetical protein